MAPENIPFFKGCWCVRCTSLIEITITFLISNDKIQHFRHTHVSPEIDHYNKDYYNLSFHFCRMNMEDTFLLYLWNFLQPRFGFNLEYITSSGFPWIYMNTSFQTIPCFTLMKG